MGLNKAILLGNLGADPELRYTASQQPVCTLRLATNERRRNAEGEWVEHTEWHSVVCFGKTAENCANFLAKGRQVLVEGRIQTRKWQDQEGKDRYKTEILASNVQFIGGSREDGASRSTRTPIAAVANGTPSTETPTPFENVSFEDDDIPF